jgi:hypothetical protein
MVTLEKTARIFEEKHGSSDSVCMLSRGLAAFISEIYNGHTLTEFRQEAVKHLHTEEDLLRESADRFLAGASEPTTEAADSLRQKLLNGATTLESLAWTVRMNGNSKAKDLVNPDDLEAFSKNVRYAAMKHVSASPPTTQKPA